MAAVCRELLELADVSLCDALYSVSRQSELENASYDLFGPNGMGDFCDLAKMWKYPGGNDHVFCSALQFSTCWLRPQFLTEVKDVAKDGEC